VAGFVKWLRAEWDRAAGVGFLLAGAVCLAVGYAGVASASYVPQALSFIASGGFFGLLLVAVGATLLITAALHDEWRKLDRIEKAIDRLAGEGSTLDLAVGDAANGRAARAVGARQAGPQRAVLASALGPAGGVGALPRMDSRPAVLVGVAGLVAAGLVGAGWTATASAVSDTTAYSAILLGIAGLALAGVASTGWTLSMRRAARARQARLLAPFGAVVTGARTGPVGQGRVAVADGLTRFHAPGCAALAGLTVRLLDRADAIGSGLTGCRLCEDAPLNP
jgi:hypothetical protein